MKKFLEDELRRGAAPALATSQTIRELVDAEDRARAVLVTVSAALGWLAAALYCNHRPDLVAAPKGKPTPLCMAFGSYWDAPGATGAWLGGWDGCSWDYVDSWPSLYTPFERFTAWELGNMARRVWQDAQHGGDHATSGKRR